LTGFGVTALSIFDPALSFRDTAELVGCRSAKIFMIPRLSHNREQRRERKRERKKTERKREKERGKKTDRQKEREYERKEH